MRWPEWRFDVALLIAAGSLLKSVVDGTNAWPFVLLLVLVFFVKEARLLIPDRRNLAEEQYTVLHQRIDDLTNKLSRVELANGLRPKVRTDA